MKNRTKIVLVALGLATLSTSVMANNIGKKLSIKAATACKNYVLDKTTLPQAAVSVRADKVYGDKKKVYVPVVDEMGECVYVHGKAVSYRILD